MSFWELVENSPEWVGVFAASFFAAVTIVVIIWQALVMKAQVRVMKWQGRISARHERIQNRLIRLEHEHEWVLQKNRERGQLLKLARDLHLEAGCLREKSETDHLHWEKLQEIVFELHSRLNILDIAVFSSPYDGWFPNLEGYVDAIHEAVIEDGNFKRMYAQSSSTPTLSTRSALKRADDAFKPISIFLDLETAIRMEFFDFKAKWDDALPS